MHVLAVTGGIGSGKSTAARYLAERGAVALDLDDIAHKLVAPGMPVLEKVAEAFGPDVIAPDGSLDAAALAERAFSSAEEARRLNAVVHPAVFAAVTGALDMLAAQPDPPPLVVLDVPLLAESPAFLELVDAVLAISATEDTRVARAVAAGMAEDDVRRRMRYQADDAERRAIADYVIENDGTLPEFLSALEAFWEDEVAGRAT